MTFLHLPKGDTIHLPANKKVISANEIGEIIKGEEIIVQVTKAVTTLKEETEKECEKLKEQAKKEGFEAGLVKWNEQLALLEKERRGIHEEIKGAIVPMAMTAIRKIIGREIKVEPKTVNEIVKTALKPVAGHHKIAIYVHRDDLKTLETERNELKTLFEHLSSLKIEARDDVSAGGCIIETEAGIINAELENQYTALEKAFKSLLKDQKEKP